MEVFIKCTITISQAKGDIIVLQQGGVLSSFVAIALFYHCESSLYLIQYSKEGVDSMAKRFLYRLVKHKINGIICPNEMVGEAYERPYCVVPDYIYLGHKEQIDIPFCEKNMMCASLVALRKKKEFWML